MIFCSLSSKWITCLVIVEFGETPSRIFMFYVSIDTGFYCNSFDIFGNFRYLEFYIRNSFSQDSLKRPTVFTNFSIFSKLTRLSFFNQFRVKTILFNCCPIFHTYLRKCNFPVKTFINFKNFDAFGTIDEEFCVPPDPIF